MGKKIISILNIEELLKKPYQNETEAAALTGKAVATLRNQRHLGKGIPYLKLTGGRAVRYKTADIVQYMEAVRIAFE